MLIDPSILAGKLKIVIENLFQAANQAIYIGDNHPGSDQLTECMVNRLHCCINDLGQIVNELEPRMIDTGCLTLEEVLTLEGYAEIRRGLVKSWEFVEARELVIIQQAANRQANAGRAGQ